MNSSKHAELANHAWSVADLLRGDYKQSDYGKVVPPFTALRRRECALAVQGHVGSGRGVDVS